MSKSRSPQSIEQVIAQRRDRVLTRRGWHSLARRIIFLALVSYVLFTQVFLITQVSGQDMFPEAKIRKRETAMNTGDSLRVGHCLFVKQKGKGDSDGSNGVGTTRLFETKGV